MSTNFSLPSEPNKALLAKYFPKKRNTEASIQANFTDYPSIEACEEDLDDDENLINTHLPVVLFTSYSFLKSTSFTFKSHYPFDAVKCNLYPKKYLTLSILRI